jgi:hypothetical protein
MGFIMEFAENLVLKLMEDPKERDRRFREHVYKTKDRCAKRIFRGPKMFLKHTMLNYLFKIR